jgi:hypothetical protein
MDSRRGRLLQRHIFRRRSVKDAMNFILLRMKTLKRAAFSRPKLGLFILAFALIGGYILIRSLAAPNPNLPGDLNADNSVNVTDLSILLSNYGTTNTNADINNDGAVNVLDLSILLSHYGSSYVPPAGSSCTKTLSPGANVASEFSLLSAGQTLCLHTGTYGSPTTTTSLAKSGTAGNPITLTTVPGEARATIEGEFLINANAPVNYVTISHLNFKEDNTSHSRVNAATCNPKGAAAIVFWGASHVIFEYNDVSQASVAPDMRESALEFSYNATPTTDVIVRYNKIHDFGSCSGFDHGIYTGTSNNGQIYGNWIYNGGCSYATNNGGNTTKGCGSGIQLYSNSNNFSVHSNVIDGTGVGLFLSNTNNDVYNNVITNLRGYFYSNGGSAPAVAYSGSGGSTTNNFRLNDYFNAGALCDNCTATSSSNITSNPLFVDPANHNYTLQSGSPAAGYGLWNGIDPGS